ncbi:hypothetical protein BWQ93_04675 [Sphingopyxis sp. QXT-31]|uniref:hypothetical protein n=1 Tax=Sphingopyxis sp. QXT-31 TaxID=1357916 RepID=UPI000979269E|nr:hypothetical protein [Sphingopyxis sp. QXT-31]APZ97861.1 hypothetical protein BWQ93_04675 [Sphingopyxis sp. QXT-31]
MRYRFALAFTALLLTGCDGMPRDAAGTTEGIERTHTMRVTVLPGTPDVRPALALLDSYARKHDARVTLVAIHGEHAHKALEDGEIDALIGHFAKASPWQADISLSKPVARGEPDDKHRPVLRIARRNGENALILATDRLVAESAQ